MTLDEWDAKWIEFYDTAVAEGKSPNKAVAVADRVMAERHGPRPPEEVA